MAIEVYTCDQCDRRRSGRPVITVTGRQLCRTCADQLSGASAGLIAGSTAGDAIATAGWFSRLRRLRRSSRE